MIYKITNEEFLDSVEKKILTEGDGEFWWQNKDVERLLNLARKNK